MLKTPYWRDLRPFPCGLGEIETQSLPPIQIDSAGRLCAILSRVCKPRLLPSFRPKQQGFCFHPTFRDMPPLSMDRARILGLRLPKNGAALLERFLAAESSSLAVSGSSLFTGRKCCAIVDSVTIPRDNQEALKIIRHGDFDIAVLR